MAWIGLKMLASAPLTESGPALGILCWGFWFVLYMQPDSTVSISVFFIRGDYIGKQIADGIV